MAKSVIRVRSASILGTQAGSCSVDITDSSDGEEPYARFVTFYKKYRAKFSEQKGNCLLLLLSTAIPAILF